MAFTYKVTDKNRTNEAIDNSFGVLVIEDAETGIVTVECPGRFGMANINIAQKDGNGVDYLVRVFASLNEIEDPPVAPVFSLAFPQITKVAADTTMTTVLPVQVPTIYRNNLKLEIENTSGVEEEFTFQMFLFSGGGIPGTKF